MRCTVTHACDNAHEEGAWACCWIPASSSLLTGSVDETVKRWSSTPDGLKLEKTYANQAGHTLGVISVDVDPTGEWAASSALDSYVRIWSLRDHQDKAQLESRPTEVWSVAFAPTTHKCMVAAAGGTTGKIKLWDATSMTPGVRSPTPEPSLYDLGAPVSTTDNSSTFVLSVAFSPDGNSLACGCMDGTVCVFDTATQVLKNKLVGHFKPVRALTFTPDSKRILTACDDTQVHFYESSGNLIEAFSGHSSWVLGVAAHPDGVHFVSASSDNSLKLWDIGQRVCVHTAKEHKDQVWDVAFSSDGTELASVGDDGHVITYSVT